MIKLKKNKSGLTQKTGAIAGSEEDNHRGTARHARRTHTDRQTGTGRAQQVRWGGKWYSHRLPRGGQGRSRRLRSTFGLFRKSRPPTPPPPPPLKKEKWFRKRVW